MSVIIIYSLVALVLGVFIGFAIGRSSQKISTIQFDVKPADIAHAADIANKEEIMVMQQITITSLISVLADKNLNEVEKQYVLKAIEVAEIIPSV